MEVQHTVVWFEIPVIDFERAQKFYAHILDGEVEETTMGEARMGFLPHVENGVSGAIIKENGAVPSSTGSLIYLNGGDDLQNVLDRIQSAGGKILLPKTQISPEIGYFALFLDTEGNRIGLHSEH